MIGVSAEVPVTIKVHISFLNLILCLTGNIGNKESNLLRLNKFGDAKMKLNDKIKATINEHCETGLYLLKFYLLSYPAEALQRFGKLETIDVSWFEEVDVHMQHFRKGRYQRQVCGLMEAA